MSEQLTFKLESQLMMLSVDDIFNLQDPTLLRIIKEDKRVERKPVAIHPSGLALYFSMWANTPPSGGVIAIGVTDDGDFEGVFKSGVMFASNPN